MPVKAAPKKLASDLPPMPEVSAEEKKRALAVLRMLRKHYPDAHCELNFSNIYELLIATMLSAQCTDANVNKATPALFAAFPTPKDYAASTPKKIEPYIKTLGLFRNKAKAVHESMTMLVNEYDGKVPGTMEDLLRLRGVARKTANVVLSNGFGINMGVVVDTHVARLSERLGLVEPGTPIPKIERKLMALFPRDAWGELSHLLVFHGRRACTARTKTCEHPVCKKFGVRCPGHAAT
ncbi:MAG: endonuclease III [Phycisphaeraceae bacterium]|nr:endonuclease III [Phycisphaeraceae bacterium]